MRKFKTVLLGAALAFTISACGSTENKPTADKEQLENIAEKPIEDIIPKGRIYVCVDETITYSGGPNPKPCPDGVEVAYVILNVSVPIGEKPKDKGRDEPSPDELEQAIKLDTEAMFAAYDTCECANGTKIVKINTKKTCKELCDEAADIIKQLGGTTPKTDTTE